MAHVPGTDTGDVNWVVLAIAIAVCFVWANAKEWRYKLKKWVQLLFSW